MKKSYTFIKTNLGKIYIEATNKSLIKVNWTNIKIIPKEGGSNIPILPQLPVCLQHQQNIL